MRTDGIARADAHVYCMASAGGVAAKRSSSHRQSMEPASNDDVPDIGPAVERLQPWSKLALAHGAYLVFAGGWPLLHLKSFEKLTGSRRERWLTKAVGASLANAGIQLIQSALRGGRVRREVRSLAVRMAVTFAAFDFYYAGVRRRISPVHLLDGAVQLFFATLWGAERLAEKRELRRPPIAAHA
jgi:hypothetical protein